MSWDEACAVDYDEWSAHMIEDVAFYVGLACDANGPVVELAVGNGRVAIPVARAVGRQVIGIDSSPAMLAQARTRADSAGVELDLREGDMRDLRLDEPAGLIYCPFGGAVRRVRQRTVHRRQHGVRVRRPPATHPVRAG